MLLSFNFREMKLDIEKQVKEIKEYFWEYPQYPFLNREALEYYTANFDRLRRNANALFDKHPTESATFWIELVRSKFILKFGYDINSMLNHRDDITTTNKAIQVIKTVFESSYQYFGLLGICEYIENNDSSGLYASWFNPKKAKNLAKKEEKSAWIVDGEKVTGKVWALHNCPLLQFCPVDIDLLKRIRNAESHEELIVKDDAVFLFDEPEHVEFSKEEIIKIANYLKGIINLCLHFYMTLLLRDRFLIFVAIMYVHKPNLKVGKLPFEILSKKEEEPENKEKKKKFDGSIFNPKVMLLIFVCVRYVTNEIWDEIRIDVPKLNRYLAKLDLEIDESQVDVLNKGALSDLYNALVFFNQDLRKMSGIEEKDKFTEIKEEDGDAVEFSPIIKDSISLAQEYLKKEEGNKGIYILIITTLGVIMAIFQPFQRLTENLKNLVRPVTLPSASPS